MEFYADFADRVCCGCRFVEDCAGSEYECPAFQMLAKIREALNGEGE